MVTFSDGILILVEGDGHTNGTEWNTAYDWQQLQFMRAMEFGTMKSMGAPNPITYSEPFHKNGFKYRFEIHDDWKPVYLENMTTKKKRRIQYFHINRVPDQCIQSTTKVCTIK